MQLFYPLRKPGKHYLSADQRCKVEKGSVKEKYDDLKGNEFAGKILGKASSCKLSFI